MCIRDRITTLIMSINTGCTNKDTPTEQDPFIVNAYKVLDTSAIVYNTTMQISSDAAKEGLLDSDQYDRIKNAAQIWYTSYQSSVKMCIRDRRNRFANICKFLIIFILKNKQIII